MQIVEFSKFTSLREARVERHRAANAASAGPITDRWALLHSPEPTGENEPMTIVENDFWSDLQFRLAYPTHRLRRH